MDIHERKSIGGAELLETVYYPNGGKTRFYASGENCFIVDTDIWKLESKDDVYNYSLLTDKQNAYMKRYNHVYRFLDGDLRVGSFEAAVRDSLTIGENMDMRTGDRSKGTDSSPLEMLFENRFTEVYGTDALQYLDKEYPIADGNGHTMFLDYVIHTKHGDIGVEENGVHYHHPQAIGQKRYREMLRKQNLCAQWGIRLFRFSTEDCGFENRIGDDIRSFFGPDTSDFIPVGLRVSRKLKLYEHQALTLERIQEQREKGVHTFLVHYPTASGKSRIIEEDLSRYLMTHPTAQAMILAPNMQIIRDWRERIGKTGQVEKPLSAFRNRITVSTFAGMARHYAEYGQKAFQYIVVDEAHHAVAPVIRRMIEYFIPDFLIGLTATDERLDHKKLTEVFGTYQTDLSLQDAMKKGIVAEANVYRIETNLDLSHVRFNGQDYVNADLEKSIRVTSRNELIAEVLEKYFTTDSVNRNAELNAVNVKIRPFETEQETKPKEIPVGELQGVVFCVNTEHASEMERVLNTHGISATAFTRKTKNPEKVMDDFRAHKIRFLCACQMISEGWDYPELGILVMARPTMSKVMYLQQIGRGLRKTASKQHVFIIDVVDQYGASLMPCSMHGIFHNSCYVPFGSILKTDYQPGDMIAVDGLVERVERIIPVNTETFEEKYGDYLNQEQLAREYFMSTGSITSWIQKGKIIPDVTFPFGNRKIYLFSPESVDHIRIEQKIAKHDDSTIRDDFFSFLHERDYSLSYKMPFLLGMLKHMNQNGEADIDDVLSDYIAFYQSRIERHLTVDRKTCPYTEETLQDKVFVKRNMLTNPFEKFERKRFMYYSKNLNMIAMNHSLYSQLTKEDFESIEKQMYEDLADYYKDMGGF